MPRYTITKVEQEYFLYDKIRGKMVAKVLIDDQYFLDFLSSTLNKNSFFVEKAPEYSDNEDDKSLLGY